MSEHKILGEIKKVKRIRPRDSARYGVISGMGKPVINKIGMFYTVTARDWYDMAFRAHYLSDFCNIPKLKKEIDCKNLDDFS